MAVQAVLTTQVAEAEVLTRSLSSLAGAIMNGFVSVTRLEPNFAQPKIGAASTASGAASAPHGEGSAPGTKWRL